MNQNTKIDQLNKKQYDRPKNMDIDLLNENNLIKNYTNNQKNHRQYNTLIILFIIIILYFITLKPISF